MYTLLCLTGSDGRLVKACLSFLLAVRAFAWSPESDMAMKCMHEPHACIRFYNLQDFVSLSDILSDSLAPFAKNKQDGKMIAAQCRPAVGQLNDTIG